jgi:hypothetical protein
MRELLYDSECMKRFCCAYGCARPGVSQMTIPGMDPRRYRVICSVHLVMLTMLTCAGVGDPSAFGEAQRVAQLIGLDWNELVDAEPLQVVSPEKFVCLHCGGRMQAETIGMYSGKRWIHTCGISMREHRGNR